MLGVGVAIVTSGVGARGDGGVLRYGLSGIEVVLRPALLYGLLTVLVAVVFAGVTTGLSAVLPAGLLPRWLPAAAHGR